MSTFNYKASNIARAEEELNTNFFTTLEGLGEGTPSFRSLLMLLRAGGLTEDEADTMLEEKGIEESLAEAVEALGKAGFLAKLKEKAAKSASQPNIPSQSTGKKTKL